MKNKMSSNDSSQNSFLYFAFGSNLLTERIHLNNPSAEKVGIGKLKGYRLDFNQYSNRWKGAIATIIEDDEHYVYGVLWRIDLKDKQNLDRQEEVHNGMYRPIEVAVEAEDDGATPARSYQLVDPTKADKRPSFIYLDVILRGAREHGLPQEYIESLQKIIHNGYKGNVDVQLSFNPPSSP